MGRLTEVNVNGIYCKAYNCENTCYECDSEAYCYELKEMIEKLAHYEDLEEQGRLIKLPCAVGDTVWYIKEKSSLYPSYHTYYDCYDFRVSYITINKHGIIFGRKGSGMVADIMFHANDIGKTAFLTKEEAKAKLKEKGGGSDD